MSKPKLTLSLKKHEEGSTSSSPNNTSQQPQQQSKLLQSAESLNQSVAATTSATKSQQQHRYIVKFAHIPSEAFYCTATTWRDLCIKAQQVWGLDRPYFTFQTANAIDKIITFRLTCAADFESVWANEDAPAMRSAAQRKINEEALAAHKNEITSARMRASAGNNGPFFGEKLFAHDHRAYKQVAHSADYYQYSLRPLASTGLLAHWPARFALRHSVTDELMVVADDRESGSWGYAVQKCQSEWGVLRPVFRYIDDIEGERMVITVVSAEDFIDWYKRRRPLWPELLVFEHAAPSLLQENRAGFSRAELAAITGPNSSASELMMAALQHQGSAGDDDAVSVSTYTYEKLPPASRDSVRGGRNLSSAGSMGVAPLEPDVPRDASFFPSQTPGFMIEHKSSTGGRSISRTHNNNNNGGGGGATSSSSPAAMTREAEQLLSTFRPESLVMKSEREKYDEERAYQIARERHMRELEKALTSPTPDRATPRNL